MEFNFKRLLLGSFIALLAADVVYAVELLHGTYSFGGPTDGLWMASYALIGIAGTVYTLTLQTAHDLIIVAIIFAIALIYYFAYLLPRRATSWRMLTAVEEVPEEPELEISKDIV